MKELYQKYAEMFNQRSLRERALLALGLLAVTFLLFNFLVFQSQSAKKAILQSRFDTANQELNKLSAEEKVFVSAFSNSLSSPEQRELVQLQTQLDKLDQDLDKLSVGLIEAEKLPRVLHDVLSYEKNLQLVTMTTTAPEPVEISKPVETVADSNQNVVALDDEDNTPPLYKHTVKVVVRGKYFDVQHYLASLEKLSWKFYWSSLDYRVDDYPYAEVMVEVYTLSPGKGAFDG